MANKNTANRVVIILMIVIASMNIISAGVGIKWGEESVVVKENEKTCLSYGVYNPWPRDSYVGISVSKGLEDVLFAYDSEGVLVPSETSSDEAIPIELCFDVVEVYDKDCLLGDSFICELKCNDKEKIFVLFLFYTNRNPLPLFL